MTQTEALRLALEALEDIGDEWGFTSQRTVPKRKEAIACLRLVIDAENISSKPMAWEQFYPEMGKPKLVEVQDGKCKHCTDGCPACDARKLPEQEPVAIVAEIYISRYTIEWTNGDLPEGTKLYTTPPQRTWVGLTDEDRFELAKAQYGWEDLLFAAEAKLKKKNT